MDKTINTICGHPECELMFEAMPWISKYICWHIACRTSPMTQRAIDAHREQMIREGRKPIVARRING